MLDLKCGEVNYATLYVAFERLLTQTKLFTPAHVLRKNLKGGVFRAEEVDSMAMWENHYSLHFHGKLHYVESFV